MIKSVVNKNVSYAYIDQFYLIIAGLIFAPIYIENLGISSYGLFGLFSVAQAIFQLLDAGLAPTLTRQTARYIAGVNSSDDFKVEFKIAEIIFYSVGLIGSIALIWWTVISENIWVSSPDLSVPTIKICLVLLFITVSARFIGSLYKGVLRGAESHVLLASIGIISTTIRFVIAIPIVINSNKSPIPFFLLQCIVAILEIIVYRFCLAKYIPTVEVNWSRILFIKKGIMRLAGAISLLSFAWIFINTVDRLILTKMLSLADYGIYTIALNMAGLINIALAPLGIVAGPRLANIISKGEENVALNLYKKLTEFIAFSGGAIAALLTFFGAEVVWIWIGNKDYGEAASKIIAYYSLGYVLISISSIAYLYQLARGRLRLHVIGAIVLIVLIPIGVYLGAKSYGMEGAAVVWVSIQIFYFIIWIPLIHNDIVRNFHGKWILNSIMPRLLTPFLWCGIASHIDVSTESRLSQMLVLALIFTTMLLPAIILIPDLRNRIFRKL